MQTHPQRLLAIPHEWFRQMRATSPVHFNERPPFHWSVFRYDEAQQVLTHPEIFSSAPAPESRQPALPSILGMDDPRHRKLRNIVSRAFTPRMVADVTPRIYAVVNEILDAALARGEMDVIQDLAYPLPVTIIAELVGIPAEKRADFRRWSGRLVSGTIDEMVQARPEERTQALVALRHLFAQQLEEHRRTSQDDLMTSLLQAEVDGEQLSEEELVDFCQLLLIAGHETTANLIGNAMVCFEEHPEVITELRQDPALMPGAVEEILRCYPSVPGASRVATQSTRVGDQQIEANQTLHIFIASANADEQQFPDAQRFDIRRDPNQHLGFGYGIHYCLGAPLARLETRLVLNLMIQRLQHIQRLADRPAEAVNSFLTYGVKHFWIGCQPAS